MRSVSSYFAAPFWEPVCAVGAHSGGQVNAQICVSIAGASIVDDMPRLLVSLWKSNYTHDLVNESGTMACTLLSEAQASLVEPLGLHSGRDRPDPPGKLAGLEYRLTDVGDPYFPAGSGYVDCAVIDSLDLGDCTTFLVAVLHDQRLGEAEPMTWERAKALVGPDVMRRYEEQFRRDGEAARRVMRWAGPLPH